MDKEEAKRIISDIDRAWRNFSQKEYVALEMAIESLEQESKTGHWIGDGNYICSCCKCNPLDFLEPEGLDGGSYMDTPMKYCPNCGAKMVEDTGSEG